MKIDVFGAVFLDKYIYEVHDSIEEVESIGGSGLNIALGLHLLGWNVKFYGNIGRDERGSRVLKELEHYGFPMESIFIKDGITGLFVAKNDKVLSVEREVNAKPLNINMDLLGGECAVITTELNRMTIEKILSYRWEKIFIDIGPRPHILEDIYLPRNVIKIGNAKEDRVHPCHVVKLGLYGAKWGDILAEGSNKSLPYTIGAGDLFDTILIHNILKGRDRKTALSLAVEYAERGCKIKGGFKLEKIRGV